ncbi:MotA/TolQ/ExbB proton channel family protein [Fibrobacterota bacterium]
MLIDYLYETLRSGGWVIIPIFLVGGAGFFLAGLVMLEMKNDFFQRRFDGFFEDVFSKLKQNDLKGVLHRLDRRPGMVSHSLKLAIKNRRLSEETLRNLLAQELRKELYPVDRHLPLIGVLAAVAPLLGLLGTVTGMVHTFQIIMEFGNSNPILLAGGISEALITTQSGLLIAFPLVLFKHQLEDRISWTRKQVELGLTRFFNQRYYSEGSNQEKME